MTHLVVFLALPFVAQAERPSSEELLQRLCALADAVQTAHARVLCEIGPGREKQLRLDALRAAIDAWGKFGERKKQALAEAALDRESKLTPVELLELDEVWLRYPMVRWEHYGEARRGGGRWGRLEALFVYRGESWEQWLPPERQYGDGRAIVYREKASSEPRPLGAILGLGVPLRSFGSYVYTKGAYAPSGQIHWRELMPLLAPPKPVEIVSGRLMVECSSRVQFDSGGHVWFTRFYFSPEPPYSLLALELQTAYSYAPKYRRQVFLEWSEFKEIQGLRLPTVLSDPNLSGMNQPVAGQSPADWPATTYEAATRVYRLEGLELNVALADERFQLPSLASGTPVLDFVRGEQYVVGNAGEILDKQALKGRELLEHPGGRSWLIWLAWGGAALSVVIVLWWMIRRLGGG